MWLREPRHLLQIDCWSMPSGHCMSSNKGLESIYSFVDFSLVSSIQLNSRKANSNDLGIILPQDVHEGDAMGFCGKYHCLADRQG